MKQRSGIVSIGLVVVALFAVTLVSINCQGPGAMQGSGDAASKVYVAPGSYDEFYAFMSGGFSGQVTVYGLPSGRLLKLIPVFSQHAENGWGYTEETKAMLKTSYGFIPWDDAHHPELSQTNGVPDGRWLFINGNNTPRVARIDLTTFETDEIIEIPELGRQPRLAVRHARTSEYVVASTRFSVPIPQRDMSIDDYKENFKGTITFIKADTPGKMDIAFQILVPGYNYDLCALGQRARRTAGRSSPPTTPKRPTRCSRSTPRRTTRTSSPRSTGRRAEECVADGKARQHADGATTTTTWTRRRTWPSPR